MLTLSIQAGGGSTRMGQDKGILPFLGKPLVQRVMERVSHLANEVIVTTNDPLAYGFLEVPLYSDVIPGAGALSGIYTALVYAQNPLVAVVACDLPFANPSLLAYCRDILLASNADAVIPATERGLEPLHAVYRKATCLPLVEAALKDGKRRVISWFEGAIIHTIHPETITFYDPDGVTFWNVNTPEELKHAQEKALELEGELPS